MTEAKEEADALRDDIKQEMIWHSYPFMENDYYYDITISTANRFRSKVLSQFCFSPIQPDW